MSIIIKKGPHGMGYIYLLHSEIVSIILRCWRSLLFRATPSLSCTKYAATTSTHPLCNRSASCSYCRSAATAKFLNNSCAHSLKTVKVLKLDYTLFTLSELRNMMCTAFQVYYIHSGARPDVARVSGGHRQTY